MNEAVIVIDPAMFVAGHWRNSNRNIWMVVRVYKTIFLLMIVVLSARMNEPVAAERDIPGSGDARFEDDWNDSWEEKAEEVNEGELRILKPRPDLDEHHHHSQLRITQESLKTGWVDMVQCHTNLDATSALQIVFNQGRVRDLRISSHSKIARAWVEKNTVQLEDISPGSRVCLSLKTRALRIDDKKIILKNGPFMRRFLDGYYPMRVSMQVEYPTKKMHFLGMKPEGIIHRIDSNGRLEIDVRFEGRLNTEISFELKSP
jgi:hypothetical protein